MRKRASKRGRPRRPGTTKPEKIARWLLARLLPYADFYHPITLTTIMERWNFRNRRTAEVNLSRARKILRQWGYDLIRPGWVYFFMGREPPVVRRFAEGPVIPMILEINREAARHEREFQNLVKRAQSHPDFREGITIEELFRIIKELDDAEDNIE